MKLPEKETPDCTLIRSAILAYFTFCNVCRMFEDTGYPVKHLDNHHSPTEREEILKWFRKTEGAILTSVSHSHSRF